MTQEEILNTIHEYKTTDSISRKDKLFNLIKQESWKIWLQCYSTAYSLYLECRLPIVKEILEQWGYTTTEIYKSVDKHSYYTQLNIIKAKSNYKIVLYGLTERGLDLKLPTSITVRTQMFNQYYLDHQIREIKPNLHRKLNDIIYQKERELKALQDVYKKTENPILDKLKGVEPGTPLWYERWCNGKMNEAKEVKFMHIEDDEIIVDDDGVKVRFDHNGTLTSENDYTHDCMLFPTSNHKHWDGIKYIPASTQRLITEYNQKE